MRLERTAKLLLPRLQEWSRTRPHEKGIGHPDFQIIKDAVSTTGIILPNQIYLDRFWVLGRNDYCNMYLHHYYRDDEANPHDHQYASVSLTLTEGLRETYIEDPEQVRRIARAGKLSMIECGKVRYPQLGQLVFRSSKMAHRLQVLPGSDPWTLFITGPRVNDSWGFWCNWGRQDWKDYTKVTQGHLGRGTGTSGVGVGCGEE